MKQQWKKIAGFVIIIGSILVLLQLSSMVSKNHIKHSTMVELESGPSFVPKTDSSLKSKEKDYDPSEESKLQTKKLISESPEKELPESAKKTDVQPLTSQTENHREEPKTNQSAFQKETVDTTKKGHQIDNHQAKNFQEMDKGDIRSSQHLGKESSSSERKLKTITLSNAAFLSLDRERDELIKKTKKSSKKHEGMYGWGILNDYEHPDKAHQILGGIPFAIDRKQKNYYRINLKEKNVQPAFGISAYGTTGVEANDSQLLIIIKKAFKQGIVKIPPGQLDFYYLFSLSTEQYIHIKIVNAFEWFLSNAKHDYSDTNLFRKKARLRVGIWRAVRDSGGEIGVVIPVYFEFENKQLFFSPSYYHYDTEARRLNIHIEKQDYL